MYEVTIRFTCYHSKNHAAFFKLRKHFAPIVHDITIQNDVYHPQQLLVRGRYPVLGQRKAEAQRPVGIDIALPESQKVFRLYRAAGILCIFCIAGILRFLRRIRFLCIRSIGRARRLWPAGAAWAAFVRPAHHRLPVAADQAAQQHQRQEQGSESFHHDPFPYDFIPIRFYSAKIMCVSKSAEPFSQNSHRQYRTGRKSIFVWILCSVRPRPHRFTPRAAARIPERCGRWRRPCSRAGIRSSPARTRWGSP